MMSIAKFATAVTIGFVAHQTAPLFDRWEANGAGAWSRLGRYAVGTIALSWAFALMVDQCTTRKQAFESLLTASVAVGAGVGLGYALDD